tara:strand:+ start:2417 stop:3067 length:651 start_codon:yes stop_codon:yes gene_type:complete
MFNIKCYNNIINREIMEVQAHGNYFEDIKIRELTGFSKDEYDSMKDNGYTSSMDIVKGLHSDRDVSVKTAKGRKVDCGDILRRRSETKYDIIIGVWDQVGDKKIFHTEYTFHIKPEHETLLWGKMSYEKLREFNDYIKSIPEGRTAQQNTKVERQLLKTITEDTNAQMKIHPKVDSKKQRRVQCSFNIDKLIKSGVEYEARPIRIVVESKTRTFNK